MRKYSAVAFLLGFFIAAVYLLLVPTKEPPPDKYTQVSFNDLSGWKDDDHASALEAFQISCARLLKYPDDRSMNDFATAFHWKPTCRAALEIDPVAARKFFEANFSPLRFQNNEPGLFTGYYAPLYKGSRQKSVAYDAPLYMVPADLQELDLGQFDQRLSGRSIIGEVKDDKFVPYKNRKQIDRGALDNQQLELVWLDKKEAFFLQIQGSGFIELENGEVLHLGYAQRNGRPYRAIGQYLIESGDVAREDMSLQAIMNWMVENPDQADDLMWKNPSYVFFQARDSDKPVGSLGVGLTPERSLAVDRSFIPLGAPLWLETYRENAADQNNVLRQPSLNRLVIAQDTGGAIKGEIRGDVYWGIGASAELKAGPMKDVGTYFILVPNSAVQPILMPLEGST